MNDPVIVIGAIGTVGLFFAFLIWMAGAGPVIKRTGHANPKLLKAGWWVALPSVILVAIAVVILWVQTVFFGK